MDEFRSLGLPTSFAEEYFSVSRRGVLRGLHFQTPPMDHEKIVCYAVADISSGGIKNIQSKVEDYKSLSEEIGVGEPTLRDIVKELEKPARDPRDEIPKPILRTKIGRASCRERV